MTDNKPQDPKPRGWVETTIRGVTDGNIESSGPSGDGTFTYVDISSIDNRRKCIVEPKILPVTDAPSRAKQRLRRDDTVVSMTRPNLNAVAFIRPELDGSIGSTGLQVLRPLQINPGWLYYLVQTTVFVEQMSALVQGALYPAVRPKDILDYEIPLAPRPEQDRIVAEIEKQFTRLDAATASLQQVRTKLDRYRASILRAACEGRLVPTEAELASAQKRNYEPAARLIERILAERQVRWEQEQLKKMRDRGEEPKNDKWKSRYQLPAQPDTSGLPPLPEGWAWSSLGQLFDVHVGATPSRAKPEYWNGDIPWVSSGEVAFCRIAATKECITELGLKNSSTTVHPLGTVLLGMIGEGKTRGQAAILDISACNNQNSAAIRVSDSGLPPEYVYRFLESQYESTRNAGSGNNQPALNKSIVQSLLFPVPPEPEQQRIVTELEARISVTEELGRLIAKSLLRAARLRQSILKRAFAGQLVTQDPSDEPSSVLLDRIRAERAQAATSEAGEAKGKRGRRKTMAQDRPATKKTIIEALTEAKTPLSPEKLFSAKALVCALGVRPSAKPSSWTVCHIWGYDDDRFATESMIVKDPRYYSCIGNMVWLPTPLKGFTDAVPEIKRMLRTCAYYLYGWAPRTLIETELAETKVIPGGYPESWPTADRNSPPRGTSPYSQCVKDAVERRKRQLRMRLANKALTHYPRQEVRDVLAFWHVEDV